MGVGSMSCTMHITTTNESDTKASETKSSDLHLST